MTGTRRVLYRLLGLGVAGAAAILTVTSLAGQTPPTLERITKAWKQRQDAVRSARFAWTERETVPKGFVTNLVGSLPWGKQSLKEMGIQPGTIVPPEDTTFDVPSSIALDGEKLRYLRAARQWSGAQNAYVTQPRLTVFDGKVGKTFYKTASASMPWPQGLIRNSYPDASSLYLSPIMMVSRPSLAEVAVVNLQTMSLTGRRSEINGRSCLELEYRLGNSLQRLWLDPSRDYVVVRFMSQCAEQTRSKVDIVYRKDSTTGWVPERWNIMMFYPNGTLESSVRAAITNYEINAPLDDAEFDIEFPPGTRVRDSRDPNSPVDYIVKEGQKKRMIRPEELGATYEQLVHSSPGEAWGPRNWSFFSWPVAFAGLVVVVAGGLLLRRGKRPRETT